MVDIKLNAFEGPFDLLFHLIEKNEIDILDIPIAELTDQYLAYLDGMPPDMDGLSAFIVMAATLLEIKTRMLLPKPPQAESADEEDPRETLVQRLLEYKLCQAMADHLRERAQTGPRMVREPTMVQAEPTPAEREAQTAVLLEGLTTESLWRIFNEVIARQALKVDRVRAGYDGVTRERFTVADRIAWIRGHLSNQRRIGFSGLFDAFASRGERVTTFLAVLEMIRLKWITVTQADIFAEIEIEGTMYAESANDL